MADSGHPPAELHERLLICRTIKLNAGALGGHRRCCHAKMQKNAQNKPQIARLILCVHTTLQVYCNLFLTFCARMQAATEKIRDVPAGAECHVAQFGYDEAQTQTRSTGRVRGEALRYMRHRKPRLQRGYERGQESGKQCKAVPTLRKQTDSVHTEPACFMLVGALPQSPQNTEFVF